MIVAGGGGGGHVKTTAGDGMLMLQAAGVSVMYNVHALIESEQ